MCSGVAATFSTPTSPRRRSCARSPIAGGVIQQSTTIGEQLLALSSQQEATPDAIEKFQTEFLLKITDMPGQSGLSNAQGAAPPWRRCPVRPR